MRARTYHRLIALVLVLASMTLNGSSPGALAQQGPGVNGVGEGTPGMADTAGNTLALGGLNAVGEFSAAPSAQSVAAGMQPPSILARQDYQNVYEQAQNLLATGINFRLSELQLLPSCTGASVGDCQQNYQNFNAGRLFYRYCATYDQLDANGYCRNWDTLSPAEQQARIPDLAPERPLTGAKDIRNTLIRAREMYGFLALADPADLQIQVGGQPRTMREIGKTGVLTATREIANIHMIFGNEFLVDALDYRFGGSDQRADQIIAEEIRQLEQALEQFSLAVDTLSHAFNADFGGPGGVQIGDYFGALEFDLFGIVSERMVTTIAELADRHRQRGQDQLALDLYAKAFANQYVQAMALAAGAAQQNEDFMENGGWEIITNLGALRARTQAIHDGINPFGFVDEYVPLQTYSELRALTQNDFLRDSTEDEDRAANAQREFDRNRTALAQELQNLRLTYDTQLLELCGPNNDDFRTCAGGGLMEQNRHSFDAAYNRIRLVERRLLNVPEQIKIEEERAGRVIELTLANGEAMAVFEYAKGVISSYRVTEATVDATSSEWHAGAEVRAESKVCLFSCGDGGFFGGTSVTAAVFAGYRYSDSHTESVTTIWDPAAEELGFISSLQQLQQAATDAAIIGANSEATIKNLLLQQAELMIEVEIALNDYNRVAAEHNALVDRYHNLLNLRVQAQDIVADSYLSNPAYRILRDSLTVEAARSHGLAAQFGYLTAKALEYEFLARYPGLNDIFKARTADDVDNFLNDLEAFRVAIGSPGKRNRYPYRISLAKDLLGLSDQNLNPDGSLPAGEVAQRRLAAFQRILQQQVITDTNSGQIIGIELPFTTSLLDNRIFTPNVWNNRIAGVGLPPDVPGTQGIALNLLTRQFGDLGTPEVQLTHDGHASYRTAVGAIIEYVPENARLSGYPVPDGFASQSETATILTSVNGNGRGTPSSAFFNRSVAASNWTLRIDLKSPFNATLQLAQVEDIEINMDTTGIALANQVQAAEVDATRLQATFTQGGE